MGQRAIRSWISRHSYHLAGQIIKHKKLEHRVSTLIGLVKLMVSAYPAALIPLSVGELVMRVVRYLQHWLGGTGARLQGTDFVPVMHLIRQWADTFPWAALVSAIEHSFATRFPKKSPRGRRPVAVRVLSLNL
jgi:ABC-type branched-subunit amino acid transport system permease subunit